MTWLSFYGKQWQRRPLRTALTAAGVALAIGTLFSLLALERGYERGLARELDGLGAHVLVVPKGCPYDAASIALHGASWPCYLKESYLEEIRAIQGIAAAAPVLMSAFRGSAGNQSVFVGIDTNMLHLRPAWRIDGTFPRATNAWLAGSQAAEHFGWKLGAKVALPDRPDIAGVLQGVLQPTHGPEDHFVFVRMKDAQRLLHREGELTHILVRLADPTRLEDVVRALRGCDAGMFMNVIPVAHLFRTIQNLILSTRWLLASMGLVALLVAATGISNTLLMAVSERTREIGVLRALGASRAQIFALFVAEAVQVCLAGALFGLGGAVLCGRLTEEWLRRQLPFAPTSSLLSWDPWLVLGCVSGALSLGVAAALVPAWRAASLSPIEAMRNRGVLS